LTDKKDPPKGQPKPVDRGVPDKTPFTPTPSKPVRITTPGLPMRAASEKGTRPDG
jgi:hypothetical protein